MSGRANQAFQYFQTNIINGLVNCTVSLVPLCESSDLLAIDSDGYIRTASSFPFLDENTNKPPRNMSQ
jgi:hypothetical protein